MCCCEANQGLSDYRGGSLHSYWNLCWWLETKILGYMVRVTRGRRKQKLKAEKFPFCEHRFYSSLPTLTPYLLSLAFEKTL